MPDAVIITVIPVVSNNRLMRDLARLPSCHSGWLRASGWLADHSPLENFGGSCSIEAGEKGARRLKEVAYRLAGGVICMIGV